MQPLQRRAILAFLSMIESAIREIRMVLDDSGAGAADKAIAGGYVASSAVPVPTHDGVLSDAQEESLEKMMELNRLAMLKEAGNMAERFYRDAPVSHDFFGEDGP